MIDFHSARRINLDADEKGASYRYTITTGGCGYMIISPVLLDTGLRFHDHEQFDILIDAACMSREVRYERRVCVDSFSPASDMANVKVRS